MCLIYDKDKTRAIKDCGEERITLYKVYSVTYFDLSRKGLSSPFKNMYSGGTIKEPGEVNAFMLDYLYDDWRRERLDWLSKDGYEVSELYDNRCLDICGLHCLRTAEGAERFKRALDRVWLRADQSLRVVEVTALAFDVVAAGLTETDDLDGRGIDTVVVRKLNVSEAEFKKAVQ